MSGKYLLNCMKVMLLPFFLLMLQSAYSQHDLSDLDGFLDRNKKNLGGEAALVIWKDGKVIYQKAYSEDFSVKSQAPLIYSSKWLTAALVLNLADEGKFKLDDPVVKYIPLLKSYLKNYITLRHCLSETAGIEREGKSITRLLERKKFASLEEEAAAIAAKEISDAPGKEFFFGHYGLVLAARVCEVVTKKSFDRLIQERIIRPLKMKGTSFTDENGNSPNPNTGGVSTANDYLNFLIMLLNQGKFEGKQILSPAALKEIESPSAEDLPAAFSPQAANGLVYALGCWVVEKSEGGKSQLLTCPSFYGSWPWLDHCRNYAAVLLVKNELKDPQRKIADQLRDILENEFGPCNQ